MRAENGASCSSSRRRNRSIEKEDYHRDDRQKSVNPVFLAARKGAEARAKELSESSGNACDSRLATPNDEDAQKQAEFIEQRW